MAPGFARVAGGLSRPCMPYRQITDTIFADSIGPGGLERPAFAPLREAAAMAAAELRQEIAAGKHPCLSIARETGDLASLTDRADALRRHCGRLVVIGTGGSSLGAQAAVALGRAGARLEFLDGLDGRRHAELIESEDFAGTGLLIVSKSGATPEILAQALVLLPALREAVGQDALRERVCLIVEPGGSPLRRLAAHWGLDVLDHDPAVGGRFSVLSLVGMLPALFAGVDARALRGGADTVLNDFLRASLELSPPAEGAALMAALNASGGVSTSVLMPYDDRLSAFAQWYGQLWAESLGKDGRGMTPVAARGPRDQHSQLQLWLDGPGDKVFSLILNEGAEPGPRIDLHAMGAFGEGTADDIAYLDGKTIGDVSAAMGRATADALARRGRPVRVFALGALDARTLGALFMHFMLETILAGRLMGVDPFGQPAVEEGKDLARRYLRES